MDKLYTFYKYHAGYQSHVAQFKTLRIVAATEAKAETKQQQKYDIGIKPFCKAPQFANLFHWGKSSQAGGGGGGGK